MKYLKLVYKTHALIWLLTTEWKTSCFRSECWWPTCPPPCWSSSSADGSTTASAGRTTPTGATSAPPPPLHPQCCRRCCRERRSGWWTWYWECHMGSFCKIHFLQDRMFCLDIAPKPTSIYRMPKSNPRGFAHLQFWVLSIKTHFRGFSQIYLGSFSEKSLLWRDLSRLSSNWSCRRGRCLTSRLDQSRYLPSDYKNYRSSLLFSQMKK